MEERNKDPLDEIFVEKHKKSQELKKGNEDER